MDEVQTQVVDFWFRELTPEQWFRSGGPKLDVMVRERFGALLEKARAGELDGWASSPRGRLALILVLDQFSRHIHRGTPDAFAADPKAQKLCREGIAAGMDKPLTFSERHFFYMPLMHSEDPAVQAMSLDCYKNLAEETAVILDAATAHSDIVERYGRFPHRNAILGRSSTTEEEEFLASEENRFA